jgi:hypothetical protein
VPREGKIVYVPPAQSDHVIRLPATLEQVLDLNPDASYFGDALTAQHCTTPGTIAHGSGYNLLFGGFAMMDSHLSGKVRITFTAPQGDWTTFQVRFEGGLRGAEAVLAAPVFFRMPGQQQSVEDVPGKISQGRLNLRTGEVNAYSGEVSIWASFFNTALFALRQVNPHLLDSNRQRLLDSPLSFPGEYGSAFVRFDPRPDGTLDFTFCGTTFVPLGAGASFPLNFSGPSRQFASIPASGTVLHPHIAITTRASEPPADKTPPPDIRFNTLQEYTLFSPISSFGDLFTLDAPELGGRALGRSRLLGRLQVQFGPRCGNSVPIVTSLSSAGGLLAPLNPSPIADAVESQGGRLMPGPEGFGTLLRFPLRTYALNDLFVTDDMFDISVGALDVRTGELIHPLVHRGFINQDVIFALLRIEPRTRRDSFHFRGPGSLKMARRKGSVFRSFGQIYVPYPAGYKFPETNLSTGIVTNGGRLDPYLWIWAVQDSDEPNVVRSGKADRVLSGKGELFSYRLTIPSDVRSRKAEFVYENHSQNAKFTMHSLAWVGFGNSGTGGQDDFDTVTFSCFGVWSSLHGKDQIVQAAVQLSKAQRVPWLGVQIARAEIGDADTPLPPTTYPVPALGGLVFNSQTR